MSHYKTILVASELSGKNDEIMLSKAHEFAEEGTDVFIIHAVEHMSSYGAAYGVSAGIDVEEILVDEAKKNQEELCNKYNISDDH